jgi:predicted NUDIX family NTP pyrophosphohydrolase
VPKTSAGLLLYQHTPTGLRVMLVHPGGPLWAHKDLGAWSIPKGEIAPGEEPLAAARRETREETGFEASSPVVSLGQLRQPGGKTVHAWAMESHADPRALQSNTFSLEWPKGSGQVRAFPEVDRAEWFDLAEARRRILTGQAAFLDRLVAVIGPRPAGRS